MGGRIRALILVVSLIGVGVLIGSVLAQRRATPPAAVTVETARRVAAPRARVRVEVLNSGGTTNLARTATDVLREVGFDVVYFGNADRFDRDSSVVLDRVGRLESARAVADALGVRTVLSQPDSNLFVDVSVWLGKDWEGSEPAADPRTADPRAQRGPGEAPPERAWWDLRRFVPRREPAPVREGPAGTLVNPPGSGGR